MSTRSRIGIQNQNGTVSSIYCHFDGYPSGVGATLHEHYSDREKLQQLIELGDISSLGKDTTETQAYHRDRGETLHNARVEESLEHFAKSDYEEYGYVYTLNNVWVTHE
jgi:hypothetical protein